MAFDPPRLQRIGWIADHWWIIFNLGSLLLCGAIFLEAGELVRGRIRRRHLPGWPSRKARLVLVAVIAITAFLTAFTIESEAAGFAIVTAVAMIASIVAIAFGRGR